MGKLIAYTGLEYSGRTTVILNKALSLSKRGCSVLVIDADQTRGRLAALLNLEQKELGLVQAVTSLNSGVFTKCFIKEKKTEITYLTLPGTAKSSDGFSLTRKQAEHFYNKVKMLYDYILVDCGSILYEALSMVALCKSDKIFIVLPTEKRGVIWLNAVETILNNFNKQIFRYVAVNLCEIPEIASAEIFENQKYTELPYIFNMRDYLATGDIFMQKPTGKKASDYVRGIHELTGIVKE